MFEGESWRQREEDRQRSSKCSWWGWTGERGRDAEISKECSVIQYDEPRKGWDENCEMLKGVRWKLWEAKKDLGKETKKKGVRRDENIVRDVTEKVRALQNVCKCCWSSSVIWCARTAVRQCRNLVKKLHTPSKTLWENWNGCFLFKKYLLVLIILLSYSLFLFFFCFRVCFSLS